MTADPAHDDSCMVGVDFGTLSGRAVVVRVSDGAELGAATRDYRHGVMDAELAAASSSSRSDPVKRHGGNVKPECRSGWR